MKKNEEVTKAIETYCKEIAQYGRTLPHSSMAMGAIDMALNLDAIDHEARQDYIKQIQDAVGIATEPKTPALDLIAKSPFAAKSNRPKAKKAKKSKEGCPHLKKALGVEYNCGTDVCPTCNPRESK